MERAAVSCSTPLEYEVGLSCEGLVCRRSSPLSKKQQNYTQLQLRHTQEYTAAGSNQSRLENLTRLRMSMFSLVVLHLHLRVSAGSHGHSALSTVTGDSYWLACRNTTDSKRSSKLFFKLFLLFFFNKKHFSGLHIHCPYKIRENLKRKKESHHLDLPKQIGKGQVSHWINTAWMILFQLQQII